MSVKRLRRYQFIDHDTSWQIDETYVTVKGKQRYLYRTINKRGQTVDFYFGKKRDQDAAYEFLKSCLRRYKLDQQPNVINTDKHRSYGAAIARLKREGKLRQDVEHRQVKYLNNGIESDHAPIKKWIKSTGGFKLDKRANATLFGVETMRMLQKGQFDLWLRRSESEARVWERSAFLNRLFNVERVFA